MNYFISLKKNRSYYRWRLQLKKWFLSAQKTLKSTNLSIKELGSNMVNFSSAYTEKILKNSKCYHFKLTRMVKNKKRAITKSWWGCRATGTVWNVKWYDQPGKKSFMKLKHWWLWYSKCPRGGKYLQEMKHMSRKRLMEHLHKTLLIISPNLKPTQIPINL